MISIKSPSPMHKMKLATCKALVKFGAQMKKNYCLTYLGIYRNPRPLNLSSFLFFSDIISSLMSSEL